MDVKVWVTAVNDLLHILFPQNNAKLNNMADAQYVFGGVASTKIRRT